MAFIAARSVFPGKKSLKTKIIQTALREAFEETGVNPAKQRSSAGFTPLFIPVSNTIVYPVIGWTDEKPILIKSRKKYCFLLMLILRDFLMLHRKNETS